MIKKVKTETIKKFITFQIRLLFQKLLKKNKLKQKSKQKPKQKSKHKMNRQLKPLNIAI